MSYSTSSITKKVLRRQEIAQNTVKKHKVIKPYALENILNISL
ncbi:hypothetical protein CLM_0890 [Clostridium botulinum A2 str. Kyoto]|uniref:Uncharacterized protein n=1 Tax=Clostridium botulinum (strain Kyoto / Type A2) TaxID=536232 RepID=C1FU36_CLOBJ|nr:hypothetical protein CLM_0890 [Clostridium botulinum A2 str. Kyoto]